MSQQNGIVRIQFSQSFIPGRRMMLDGLLGGIIYEKTGDGDAVLEQMPVAQWNGVSVASQVVFEQPLTSFTRTLFQGFSKDQLLEPEFFEGIGRYKKILLGEGTNEYKNEMSSHVAYDCAAVWFFFRGNMDGVRALLENADSIGSLRRKGYGRIKRFDVQAFPSESSLFGLVVGDKVMRPVPLEHKDSLVKELGVEPEYTLGRETWKNPYRDASARGECLLPPFDVHPMTRREIAEMARATPAKAAIEGAPA